MARTPHCPCCGYGSDTSRSRYCYPCARAHLTLTEALKEAGFTHDKPKNPNWIGRDILKNGKVVAEALTCGDAWDWLKETKALSLADAPVY
jgi:hypothetical protein